MDRATMKTVLSSNLAGPQKAALIVITMGKEAAAEVFRNMRQEDIEVLTSQVARLGDISGDTRDAILEEFNELMMANSCLTEGGLEVAKSILHEALGQDKAMEVLERIQQTEARAGAFQKLNNVDEKQLVNLIQGEHPQTISLILGQLKPKQAAGVLVALPGEVQPDVVSRMATMGQISPEMVGEIEGVLKQHIAGMARAAAGSQTGGVNAVAEILNLVDRSTEKNILGVMERENPDLAIQIKNLMFVFEDLLHLGDREIQRVLKEVDSRDLAVALKLASEDVKSKIFGNLSQRAAEMLKDELDFLGPVRLKNVEDAQRRIVDTVRKLDEGGDIHISRGGKGEELIV